jgi:hypothetical protein
VWIDKLLLGSKFMEEIHIGEFEFARDYFEPIKQIVRDNNPLIGTVNLSDI